VTNIEFHDVDHHSGDGVGGVNFESEDWAVGFDAGQIIWSTQGFGENQNANALRWGSLYNFRFDADTPPVEADVTITPFRVGLPLALTAPAMAPSSQSSLQCPWDLNGDGSVGIVDFLDLLTQWGTDPGGPPDFDGDQNVGIVDLLELFSRWGDCPGLIVCGDPDAGNCFDANGTPGCAQQECCEAVCAITPECCDMAWDTACRDLASTLCGNCGDPGAGDCCLANGTPGCDDDACCNAVCLVDPICCAAAWDVLCANQAVTLCGCP
jgi:hypothetical protein